MEPSVTVCQLLFSAWIGPYWELARHPWVACWNWCFDGTEETFIGCSISWGLLRVWKNCTSSVKDGGTAGICTRSAYHRARWMAKGNSWSVLHALARNGVFEEDMSFHNRDICMFQAFSSSHNRRSNRWCLSSIGSRGLSPSRQQNCKCCRKEKVATFMVFEWRSGSTAIVQRQNICWREGGDGECLT